MPPAKSNVARITPLAVKGAPLRRCGFPPRGVIAFLLGLHAAGQAAPVEAPDISRLPPPAQGAVDFDRDIRPILEASCIRCHGPERPKGRFRLDHREAALSGGDGGAALLPGDSAGSRLIHYVAGLTEEMRMPPAGKGEPLTADQVGVLRAWIDQGARWSEAPGSATRAVTVAPLVQWITVDGNEGAFRAHTGLREGWSGGVRPFRWSELLDADTEFTVEGHGLYDLGDSRFSLEARRREQGFFQTGFETWRDYDEPIGGYYAPYGPAPAPLNDLEIDHGRAWALMGLTVPEWPRFTVGYEYQWREGNPSTLAWGVVSPDPFVDPGKAIQPNQRSLEEWTHILTFDVRHEIEGWLLEDNLRAEFYHLETQRRLRGEGSPGVTGAGEEQYDHVEASNVLRAEKRFTDWLFASAGYLYARLEGEGRLQQFTILEGSPPLTFPADRAPDVTLEQQSHTVKANAQLGPWAGLRLAGGIQSEWLRREGLAHLLSPGFTDPFRGRGATSMDRSALDETLTLQFTDIPYTVVYGIGRWQQEWIDQSENAGVEDLFDDERDFARDTDARGDLSEFGGGFTVSPWTPLALDTGYRHRRRTVDYDHRLDESGAAPPYDAYSGYPAFVRGRRVAGDEVDARLAWRVAPGAKCSLKYQYADTDYATDTDPSVRLDYTDPLNPVPVFLPGGVIAAGTERAHTGSVHVSFNPWRRLLWASTASYTRSRLTTAPADGVLLAPYDGHTFSVLTSAQFAWTRRVDLRATYSFARADYRQEELVEGLPLGMRFDRHHLGLSLIHRMTDALSVTAAYGFYDYLEPSAGGANDYMAHVVTTGLVWRWE